MKKNYCLILLLLSFFDIPLNGQSFVPVLQETNEWSLLAAACDIGGGIRVFLEGDSSLNAETYKKVWVANCGEPELRGFLREDTGSGRLWFLEGGQSAEKLIMDLSLQAGDTFYFDEAASSPSEITVGQIDTIEGRRVIVFTRNQSQCIAGGDLPIRFIEGIGPSTGFFYPTFLFDGLPFLMACVQRNDSLVYQESALSSASCGLDCITTNTGESQAPTVQVALFPNPFTESTSINISGLSQRAFTISLYGINGQLLLREQLLTPSFELRRGALPAGLYFYRIESEGEMMGSGKVAVQ